MGNTIYTNKRTLHMDITLFKIELQLYIEVLNDIRNKKIN